MTDTIEITSPGQTMKLLKEAMKGRVKLWTGARFVMADVPLDRQEASRVLPRGMKLTDPPTATLFVANYPKTAFTVAYKEAAVLIHVNTLLGRGMHCCWMVVDDDTALILGRELLGYPKKLADIRFDEDMHGVQAGVARRGAHVLTLGALRGQKQSPPPPIFDIKTFNAGGPGQFYLFHPIWLFRPKEVIHESYSADVSVLFGDSEYDPIARLVNGPPTNGRIAVSDIMGARYNLPVGLAGPKWFTTVYNMRFK